MGQHSLGRADTGFLARPEVDSSDVAESGRGESRTVKYADNADANHRLPIVR